MSKGLEQLKRAKKFIMSSAEYYKLLNPSAYIEANGNVENYVNVNYINDIEKELKALEIIIEKNVNIKDVKRSIEAEKEVNDVKLFPAVGFYNRGQYNEENWLTDNEFEIVREVIL